jgi:hypothetical protein
LHAHSNVHAVPNAVLSDWKIRRKKGGEKGKKKREEKRERIVKHTLGLSEVALLNTGLDGLVELSIESGLGSDVDLVVRRDVLLDSLATKMGRKQVSVRKMGGKADAGGSWEGERIPRTRTRRRGENAPNIPATIALFQLDAEEPVSKIK